MDETEITRQLTTFEELVKHLATKEELQRMRADLVLWIVVTNVGVGLTLAGVLIAVILYLNNQLINQFTLLLQHWRP
jgi:Na+/H+ antiporter NhaA